MKAGTKDGYIKAWKAELDNLRNMFCQEKHKNLLNRYIAEIDMIIEQIAETKTFEVD